MADTPTHPVQRSGEQMIASGDAAICVQTFGRPDDPAILLIGGAASSMDWWEDEFCERLAGAGRHVLRYDNRDTGRSTSSAPGAPDYSGADLVADAVSVLDGLGIDRAHVVGVSMGGGIAQHLAVNHPGRIITLTLISTTPDGPGAPGHPELPPMAPHVAASFAEPPAEPDWSDRDAVIASFVDAERLFSGSIPVDEDRIRRIAGRAFDRTVDIAASQTNHWILPSGEPIGARIGAIEAPTLVLHGTDDPLFPYPHGEALARAIPAARLVALPGVGHQMPPPETWDLVTTAVVDHTSAPSPA